jgi:hypothetical protein
MLLMSGVLHIAFPEVTLVLFPLTSFSLDQSSEIARLSSNFRLNGFVAPMGNLMQEKTSQFVAMF